MSEKTYTAVLKIHVVETKAPPTANYRHTDPKPSPSRDVDEVISLVLRAPSLEALQAKLAAHVALIEE